MGHFRTPEVPVEGLARFSDIGCLGEARPAHFRNFEAVVLVCGSLHAKRRCARRDETASCSTVLVIFEQILRRGEYVRTPSSFCRLIDDPRLHRCLGRSCAQTLNSIAHFPSDGREPPA